MKATREEIEQEALLKNWLDGLEPISRDQLALALKPMTSINTVEDEYLERFEDVSLSVSEKVDREHQEWSIAEALSLGVDQALKVLEWHKSEVQREIQAAKAEQLNLIVSVLCKPNTPKGKIPKTINKAGQKDQRIGRINLKVLVKTLALATGLAELNGAHSQAEVARELGVSRALISYYVITWADLLKIDVPKFRKSSSSREVFRKAAKIAWAKRKEK